MTLRSLSQTGIIFLMMKRKKVRQLLSQLLRSSHLNHSPLPKRLSNRKKRRDKRNSKSKQSAKNIFKSNLRLLESNLNSK